MSEDSFSGLELEGETDKVEEITAREL